MKWKSFLCLVFVFATDKILCSENEEKLQHFSNPLDDEFPSAQHYLNPPSPIPSHSHPSSSSSHSSHLAPSPSLWDDNDADDQEMEILVFEGGSDKDGVTNDGFESSKMKRNSLNGENDAKAASGHSSLPKAAALQSGPQSLPLGGLNAHSRAQLFQGFNFPVNPSCGMCSRERNMCQIISGIFTRSPLPYGYSLVTPIPSGVCNITIVEIKPSKNFFALRRKDGTYVLNGNWKIEATGNYGISGALFSYSSSDGNRGEMLESPGPLLEPIDLMIIYQSPNPGIKYEYRVPIQDLIGQQPQTRILPVIPSHGGIAGTYSLDQHNYPSNIGSVSNSGGSSLLTGRAPAPGTNIGSASNPIYPPIPSNALDNPQSVGSINKWNIPFLPIRPPGISTGVNRGSVNTGAVSSDGFLPTNFGQGTGPLFPSQSVSSVSHYNNGIIKKPTEPKFNPERFPGVLNTDPRTIPNRSYPLQGNNNTTNAHGTKRTNVSYAPRTTSVVDIGTTSLKKRKHPHRTRHNHGSRDILPGPAVGGNGLSPITPTKESNYLSIQSHIPPNNMGPEMENLPRNPQRRRKKGKKRKGKNRKPRFQWVFKGLTKCTKTCGGGNQTSLYSCERRRKGKVVSDRLCEDIPKPNQSVLSCNLKPCPAKWVPGDWSACSVTCGLGVQTRPLFCKQTVSSSLTMMVPEGACLTPKGGNTTKICKLEECPTQDPKWRVTEWSSCSTECGIGVRKRPAECIVMGKIVKDEQCSSLESKPDEEESCDMGSCVTNTWFFSDWSDKCSNTCGEGNQTRTVSCLMKTSHSNSSCPASNIPDTDRSCTGNSGCGGQWFSGPWSECSVSCGVGRETREVKCLESKKSRWTIVADSKCREDLQPSLSRECILEPCLPEWFTSEWSECSGSCGKGFEEREVKCLDSSLKTSPNCFNDSKPDTRRPCSPSYCRDESLFSAKNVPDKEDVEEKINGTSNEVDAEDDFVSRTETIIEKDIKESSDNDQEKAFEDGDNKEDKEEYDSNASTNIADNENINNKEINEDKVVDYDENNNNYDDDEKDIRNEDFDDDNQQANELEVVREVGSVLNAIPDKDAQGDESVSGDEDEEEDNYKDKDEDKEDSNEKSKKPKAEVEEEKEEKKIQTKEEVLVPKEDTQKSCIDRIKNCHLVFRARLCRLKYYNKLCCLTCQAFRR